MSDAEISDYIIQQKIKNEEADLIQAEIRKQKRASKKENKKSDLREAQLRRAGIKK